MGFYWALSWTSDPQDTNEKWESFSHNKRAVRVKTTVGKLMDKIMHLPDRYYMLNYHIGKVEYHDPQEIKEWIKKSHYTEFLDSLGQSTALALMAIRNVFSSEEEIRLVYSHKLQEDNQWVEHNIKIENDLCRHLFIWDGVIDDILFDPDTTQQEFYRYIRDFKDSNVNCSFKISSTA